MGYPKRAPFMVFLVALKAMGAGASGCASAPSPSPVDVVRAQIEALLEGDEAAATALLTPEARRRAPLFLARDALPAAGGAAEVERTAVWSGEREVELVRSAEGWRIRQGVLALFRADSAEAALMTLARAIEAGDERRVLELMPTHARKLLTQEQLAQALAAGQGAWRELAQAIASGRLVWASREAARAEAVVAVGAGEHRVVLVLETEGWKVFDVRPWSSYLPR